MTGGRRIRPGSLPEESVAVRETSDTPAMAMNFSTTLEVLSALEGCEVLVAIDRFEGSFKPQLACRGVLGPVRMVPEITDTGQALSHHGEDLPPDQRTWERDISFFPVGDAEDDIFVNAPAGFYFNPAEFESGSKEGGLIRLHLVDLTICVETAA
jgi:hypothetical protein